MIANDRLSALLSHWQINQEGRAFIHAARQIELKTRRFAGTGPIEYPISQKMGGRIAVPGRNLGLPLFVMKERDPRVMEYYFLPGGADLSLLGPDGKCTTRLNHHPYLLELNEDGPCVSVWRDEGRLVHASDLPNSSWWKDKENRWHWSQGAAAYLLKTLRLEVHSTFEISHVLTMNLQDLSRFRSAPPLDAIVAARLDAVLATEVVLTYAELLDRYGFSADDLRCAIAQQRICCDLVHERLDGVHTFHCYRSYGDLLALQPDASTHARLPLPPEDGVWPGMAFQFNGEMYVIDVPHAGNVRIKGRGDEVRSLPLAVVRRACLEQGLISADGSRRDTTVTMLKPLSGKLESKGRERLLAVRNGLPLTKPVSERQMRRYRSIYRSSSTDNEALVKLAGNDHRKGWWGNRVPEAEPLMERVIKRQYDRAPGITVAGCYQNYQRVCKRIKTKPVGLTTFRKRVRLYHDPQKKHGKRAGGAMMPTKISLAVCQLPHGWLPHQCVHVDQTPIDVVVKGPCGSKLERGQLTLATDACAHVVRAMYLSFGAADAECTLMVFRDYVRRHGQLPNVVIFDGGSALNASAVVSFLDIHDVRVRRREGQRPKDGAPVESQFASREMGVDRLVPGNTSHLQKPRMYTGYPLPESVGEDTLFSMYARYEQYFFVTKYSIDPHPALGGMTPEEYEKEMLRLHGARKFRPVVYDGLLLVQTSAPCAQPFHEVHQTLGVWGGNRYHWHPKFRSATRNEVALVRPERYHAEVVYVDFRGEMLTAVAKNLSPCAGRTRYEVEVAIRAQETQGTRKKSRLAGDYREERDVIGLKASHFDPLVGAMESEMLRLYTFHRMVPYIDPVTREVRVFTEEEAQAYYESAMQFAKDASEIPESESEGLLKPFPVLAGTSSQADPVPNDDCGNADPLSPLETEGALGATGSVESGEEGISVDALFRRTVDYSKYPGLS